MEKSGATIAYDYFNRQKELIKDPQLKRYHFLTSHNFKPKKSSPIYIYISQLIIEHISSSFFLMCILLHTFRKIERFYAYIEDNDLWRKSLPNATEFASGLRKREIEFDLIKNPLLFDQLQYFGHTHFVLLNRNCLNDTKR
jgi:hypothetical protein